MFIKMFTLLLFLLSLGVSRGSQIQEIKKISLTVYNDGFGIIKDIRSVTLDPGESYLIIDDTAATIQPETVSFRPFATTSTTTQITGQNF